MNNFDQMKSKIKLFYVFCFMVFLFLPLLQQITGIIPYEKLEEKREKNKLPRFSMSSLADNSYFVRFDQYYNDSYGFRDPFIKVNNTIKVKVFGVTSSEKVVLGKNGWLYLDKEYRDYSKKSLSEEEIELIVSKLEQFGKSLNDQNIQFMFFITPNKSTLYPEYMPDDVAKPKAGAQSNFELLDRKMKEAKSEYVHYFDLRPLLWEKKEKFLVYPANDSHWTYTGTYYMSLEVTKQLEQMMGFTVGKPEINLPTYLQYDRLKGGDGDIKKLLGVFNAEKIDDVPPPLVTFSNNPKKFPKTLWFRTSFTEKKMPFMTPEFEEVQYYHYQRESMKHNLNENLPGTKIVIFELTERWIGDLIGYYFPEV